MSAPTFRIDIVRSDGREEHYETPLTWTENAYMRGMSWVDDYTLTDSHLPADLVERINCAIFEGGETDATWDGGEFGTEDVNTVSWAIDGWQSRLSEDS